MSLPGSARINLRGLCVALAGALIFLLFYLGSKPIAVGLFPEPWDKLAHFVVYGAIAVLLAIGIPQRPGWMLVALVSGIGALDEWHQVYLPGRSAGLDDLLADVIAAVCAVALARSYTARNTPRGVPAAGYRNGE